MKRSEDASHTVSNNSASGIYSKESTDTLSGYKTAFPMEVTDDKRVGATGGVGSRMEGANPQNEKPNKSFKSPTVGVSSNPPSETRKVGQPSPSKNSPTASGKGKVGSLQSYKRLYPTLPDRETGELESSEQLGNIIKVQPTVFSTELFQTACQNTTSPKIAKQENYESDVSSQRNRYEDRVLDSPTEPAQPTTVVSTGPLPSAPPLQSGLSRSSLTTEGSPLSPVSYALNQIKSGNKDPAAIRRGLAALQSSHNSPPSLLALGTKRQYNAAQKEGESPKKPSPSPGNQNGSVASPRERKDTKSWIARIFKS